MNKTSRSLKLNPTWAFMAMKLDSEPSIVCDFCGSTPGDSNLEMAVRALRMFNREMGLAVWPNLPKIWCSDSCRQAIADLGYADAIAPTEAAVFAGYGQSNDAGYLAPHISSDSSSHPNHHSGSNGEGQGGYYDEREEPHSEYGEYS